MQLKTITVVAASLALAQASSFGQHHRFHRRANGTWGDSDGPKTPVLDTTVASTTKSFPSHTGKPERPVDGAKTDVADETVESSTWSDVDFPEATPVDGAKTNVADETAETQSYWGDIPLPSEDPVHGGKTDVADKTTASPTTSAIWGDYTEVHETTVEEIKTITKPDGSKVTITKTVYVTPTGHAAPAPETPVSGGHGGQPEVPVSGGYGGQPEVPVAGGEGGCGVVTTTVTRVSTVTVVPGQFYTKPAEVPAAETPVFTATWQDHVSGFETAAAPAPSQDGYMGIVDTWRAKLGLAALTKDDTLQNNAQDASNSSGGQLRHKLNPGSFAQVMAPGDEGDFEKVFVGGWLCEIPSLPGLGSGVCGEFSKGWNYAGQTGHAEILSSGKYSKIGCALGDGIWTCDLA